MHPRNDFDGAFDCGLNVGIVAASCAKVAATPATTSSATAAGPIATHCSVVYGWITIATATAYIATPRTRTVRSNRNSNVAVAVTEVGAADEDVTAGACCGIVAAVVASTTSAASAAMSTIIKISRKRCPTPMRHTMLSALRRILSPRSPLNSTDRDCCCGFYYVCCVCCNAYYN